MLLKVLDEFLQYCQRRKAEDLAKGLMSSPWVIADNFQLLFGLDFNGTTIGMATVNTMCSDKSGGVNQVSFSVNSRSFPLLFVLLMCLVKISVCSLFKRFSVKHKRKLKIFAHKKKFSRITLWSCDRRIVAKALVVVLKVAVLQ